MKWRKSTWLAIPAAAAALMLAGTVTAQAAQPPVSLGTAAPFAVLAGTTVTNTGPSVISGELGVSPGSAVTGFPPGLSGAEHAADAVALLAQSGLTTAYLDAAGRTPAAAVSADLGGQTLAPGIYKAASAMSLTGTVTLDGGPGSVFIFQAGSTLITAPGSTVRLTGGASACNVFWQAGSSATLGTHTAFTGTILALTSIAVQTGTTVSGRALARNGAVTLDDSRIALPECQAPPAPGGSATGTATPGGSPSPGGSSPPVSSSPPGATPSPAGSSPAPTPTPTPTPAAAGSPGPAPSGGVQAGGGGAASGPGSSSTALAAGGGIMFAMGAAGLVSLAAIRRRRRR
jgi:Ice-binding-like